MSCVQSTAQGLCWSLCYLLQRECLALLWCGIRFWLTVSRAPTENESFSRNTKVADHGKHISESVIEYLRTTGTIDARTEGRVSHVSHLVQSTS
jgi:hypothetical protein